MKRVFVLALMLVGLSGCATTAGWQYHAGPNWSLATSDCTNGDRDLRQMMLGCPS